MRRGRSRPTLVLARPVHRALVGRLLELYQYEFSGMLGRDLDRFGRFHIAILPGWEAGRGRRLYVIRVGGRPAGFVFVRFNRRLRGGRGNEINEFFVLRRYARQGVGIRVARDVFGRFPGRWLVKVLLVNRPALGFWRRVIRSVATGPVRVARDGDMLAFSFLVPSAS